VGVLREERVLPAGVLVTAVGRLIHTPSLAEEGVVGGRDVAVSPSPLLLVASFISPLTKQCAPPRALGRGEVISG
jgi:hypothetical protein